MDLKQYKVLLTNLRPALGSEMKKTRLCVIISADEMNRYLQTIVVAPMTSSLKSYPTRVEIKLDNKRGWIVLDQIRTIGRQRIVKILVKLSEKEIRNVKSLLKETYID
ncbi:MAG: type II toxin-antitoxin system PemK/MazF family toxin [Saprospiraceae bacterium]|nr:type II toxin-antitoxin system PemK/MazF family toxin [Saprospiraceae bacterium]